MLRPTGTVLTLIVATALIAPATAPAATAKLSGIVWIDVDGDGVREAGEPRAPRVPVTVERRGKRGFTRVARLTTSASGSWSRRVTKTATLRVKLGLPETASGFTGRRKGRSRTRDSDVSARGVSSAVRVVARRTKARFDAGLRPKPATDPGGGGPAPLVNQPAPDPPAPDPPPVIGGTVWSDANDNGVRESGEGPLAGATVEVWDAHRTAALATFATGSDGRWSWVVPAPGTAYRVRLVLPDGTLYSPTAAGSDPTLDSDINDRGEHAGFSDRTVTAGPSTTVDAGVAQPQAITIGDGIWRDANANGLREDMESAFMSGSVTLELWNDSLTQRLATTSTNSGTYSLPARAGGVYRVRASLPNGWLPTVADNGIDDGADSDVARTGPMAGVTDSRTFDSSTTTIDVGLVSQANVGNFVWTDSNGNGVQEAGEPGVAGVTVQLWNPSKTALIGSTTTNASGIYSLATIGPGDYCLRVVPPAGRSFTLTDAGADEQLDSDINAAGVNAGFTDVFSIAPNVVSTTTIDAGLLP